MGIAGHRGGQRDAGHPRKQLRVALGSGGPRLVPGGKAGQLGRKHDRLEAVETGVEPELGMLVAHGAAMVAEGTDPRCHVVRVGEDGSAVAVGPEVLARVEAGRRGDAEAARRPAVPGGAVALGVVLDQGDAEVPGQGGEVLDGGGLPEQVHRDDGLGPGPDPRRHGVGVDEQELRVAVDQDGGRACPGNRLGGGDEGVGRQDDLVAVAHAHGPEGKLESVGAVRHADAVPHLAEVREGLLEGGHLRALDECPAGEEPREAGLDLAGDLGVHASQIHQGDLHGATTRSAGSSTLRRRRAGAPTQTSAAGMSSSTTDPRPTSAHGPTERLSRIRAALVASASSVIRSRWSGASDSSTRIS